jgi:xanthine permease
MQAQTSQTTDAVDRKLPFGPLIVLGIQHVLVMYAGAITVPLIIGGALKLPPDQVAFLINADLFASGIATLIQTLGFWGFGIRLPVMMGVTFAAVGPMIAIGTSPELGIQHIFGAGLVAGLIGILLAPAMSRLIAWFPPVVTGTVITVIGVTLMEVAINWSGGGVGNPDFGDPLYLAIAFSVLVFIVCVMKFAKGFMSRIAVLMGILFGTLVAALCGKLTLAGVEYAPWFNVVTPFHFGWPRFDIASIAAMTIVLIVCYIESTGMFLAVGEICGRPVDGKALTRGLRTDGLGTVIGAVFNTFPYTSYSQNVGLVGVTGVRSRWVCMAGAIILMVLGTLPKLATIVACVPPFVIGGAGIVMFGMVATTGIRILADSSFQRNPHNFYIVAISLGVGLIPMVSQKFFHAMPASLSPLLHSGILLASVTAVILNRIFNGASRTSLDDAKDTAAAGAGHH